METNTKYLVDGKYSFTDLVDIEKLCELFEKFSRTTGFTTGLATYPNQELLIKTGWQDICTKFHRASPISEIHCIKSNLELTSKLNELDTISIHHCKNGLVNGATPIIIKGVHLADISTGQILFEKPDLEEFKVQGGKYGYDIDVYLDALRKVPIVNEKEFEDTLSFLSDMAIMLAEQGLAKLQNQEITAKLKASEKAMHEAQKIAKMGMWSHDMLTDKFAWSEEMFRMFGVEPQEVTEEFVLSFLHPDDAYIMQKVMTDSNNGVIESTDEFRIIKPYGEVLWIKNRRKYTYDESGRELLRTGITIDITDNKRTEQELINARDKAEESDRLKSAFLANMSHEIRTPMNGIIGFTSLLKDPDIDADEQDEFIDIIERSGFNLLNIITDLIDISKIEAGQLDVVKKDFNIHHTVSDILGTFRRDAEKKGLNLSMHNDLLIDDAIINTDQEKIEKILSSMVRNAIKYTRNGSIRFGYDIRTNGKPIDPPELQFYVKDTGIGIRKERQHDIFDRFIQAEIDELSAREGAGLGLAISKAYVEKLGGKVWVESELGVGSQFYFTIPFSL